MKAATLILTAGLMLTLSGCMATGEDSMARLSNEEIAVMDLTERELSLRTDMEAIGFEHQPFSTTIDTFTMPINDLFVNQYELMEQYRAIQEEHIDVQSFLNANDGKSDDELLAAAMAFDAEAESEDQKILPSLQRYESANDAIFSSNLALAGKLSMQALRLYDLSQIDLAALLEDEGMMMITKIGQFGDVYDRAKTQLDYIGYANEYIEHNEKLVQQLQNLQGLKTASNASN